MRGRFVLAKWGLVFAAAPAVAQLPPIPQAPPAYPGTGVPIPPLPPVSLPGPLPPAPLPPLSPVGPVAPQPGVISPGALPPPGTHVPGLPANPGTPQHPVAQPLELPLPQPENKFALNPNDVTVKRVGGSWQLWAGQRMLRDFGDRELDARDAQRVFRDLRPTEWASIGNPRTVVEYPLTNGRPPVAPALPAGQEPRGQPPAGDRPPATGAGAKVVIPIDLRTVRVEAVRGVWCLRDDAAIHANFGPNKADADQALAVVRRYGFNRVGMVGYPAPAMTYFFIGPDEGPAPQNALSAAALQAQIDGLTRVGIPVPGVGYVGEMTRIDPRRLEVRKDGGNWVVESGGEILGRFGPTEWAARDAARTIADGRFTEFCRVGSAGLTFFLTNGKPPTRVPFAVQGRQFDPSGLRVQQYGALWAVTENGRHLFDCASAEEGETLIRVVQAFGFDQLCHLGPTPRLGVSFFAKGR
jgi:hypothetical protein